MLKVRSLALFAAVLTMAHGTLRSQSPPATILEVEIQNAVRYFDDVADHSKLATSAVPVAPAGRTFMRSMLIGDIVTVNGKPAKGLWLQRVTNVNVGGANADAARTDIMDARFEILQPDGTPIGTVMAVGINGGSPPPGAPMGQSAGNNAVVGGTGAFLGVQGQLGPTVTLTGVRTASMVETPANRRINGGGAFRTVIHLLPREMPAVVYTAAGPAVFHSDFSPVSASRPARSGETLIVMMTGLGPVKSGLKPGEPFPSDPVVEANSPVEAALQGKPAEVINKVGWPGMVGTFRVDVRVPQGISGGSAVLQMTVAYIMVAGVAIPLE
jgi:hypothetical protein